MIALQSLLTKHRTYWLAILGAQPQATKPKSSTFPESPLLYIKGSCRQHDRCQVLGNRRHSVVSDLLLRCSASTRTYCSPWLQSPLGSVRGCADAAILEIEAHRQKFGIMTVSILFGSISASNKYDRLQKSLGCGHLRIED